ncbi:MAG: hypothetical protein IJH76_03175 [Clostridia bacterium]|nr:hypothetical protein [Clostridia bacterium]
MEKTETKQIFEFSDEELRYLATEKLISLEENKKRLLKCREDLEVNKIIRDKLKEEYEGLNKEAYTKE